MTDLMLAVAIPTMIRGQHSNSLTGWSAASRGGICTKSAVTTEPMWPMWQCGNVADERAARQIARPQTDADTGHGILDTVDTVDIDNGGYQPQLSETSPGCILGP